MRIFLPLFVLAKAQLNQFTKRRQGLKNKKLQSYDLISYLITKIETAVQIWTFKSLGQTFEGRDIDAFDFISETNGARKILVECGAEGSDWNSISFCESLKQRISSVRAYV